MQEYDLLVVGGGPGGYTAAIRCAQYGARVCLVEERELGGECLNRGCIPTKSLIASSAALRCVKAAGAHGVSVSQSGFDYAAMVRRKDRIVSKLRSGLGFLMKKRGVNLVSGKAVFVGPGQADVEPAGRLAFKKTIVATGSSAVLPAAFGHDGKKVIGSEEALSDTGLPGTLIIVGAGVIGCELGCFFASLGVKVTLLDILPTILSTEDAEVAGFLSRMLAKQGITIEVGAEVVGVEKGGDGGGPGGGVAVTVRLKDGRALAADRVILSMGRRPSLGGCQATSLGCEVSPSGGLAVDGLMRTSAPGVYAVGDVTGKLMLAHVASAQGLVAAADACGKETGPLNYSAIPVCIFTHPEAARAGLTTAQARQAGYETKVGRFPLAASGKANAMGEPDGFTMVVADAASGRMLGVHAVGPSATEIVGEGALALVHGMSVDAFSRVVRAHPTVAEAWTEAAEAVYGLSVNA